MKNKRFFRKFLVLTAVMFSMTAFSVTAYAGGGEAVETPPAETPPPETEPPLEPVPLTPEGNLSLVDDIESAGSEDKQFITVTSTSGNTFYIIIDRAADGKNTVHFLNQVDEADLLALTEGKKPQTAPAVCTCAEKCEAGSVKMDCEVCKNDRSGCVGKEPAAEEPKEEPEEKGGLNPALILLPLLLIGGGGAFYYFKFVKDKSSTKGNDDLGEYDFEDEYEDTEVEYLDDTPKEDESV